MATIFRRGDVGVVAECAAMFGASRNNSCCGCVAPCMLTSERDLTAGVQRVALARRPGRAEAEVDSSSLSVDRPPALCFLKLKRITGGRACMQGQLETAQGRGARAQPTPRRRNGQVGGVWAGGKCAGVGGGGGHQAGATVCEYRGRASEVGGDSHARGKARESGLRSDGDLWAGCGVGVKPGRGNRGDGGQSTIGARLCQSPHAAQQE